MSIGNSRCAAGLVAAVIAVAVAACQPSPAPWPSASAAPTPSSTDARALPAPSITPEQATDHTLTFGPDHFAGIVLGVPHEAIGPLTGMVMDGCPLDGHHRFSAWEGIADDAPWVLWASGTTTDPTTGATLATEFGLQAGQPVQFDAPYGPVGPSGLRLGTTAADVAIAFPHAVTSEYLAEYFNEVYTLHVVELDDTVMVIAIRGGVVVDIRWGAPTVAVGWVHERCSEGPAPFDWQSEPSD